MKYLDFKENFHKMGIFSLTDILTVVSHFHRHQLTQWAEKGYIQKLKRGLYCFSDLDKDQSFIYRVANKLYSPSYISMELALSHYGFIPESVYGITSVSTRKTQTITTDLEGEVAFTYRHIKHTLMFGYVLSGDQNRPYLIATPEKALLDFFYFNPTLADVNAIAEMRFNAEEMAPMVGQDRFAQYLAAFQSHELTKRVEALRAYLIDA